MMVGPCKKCRRTTQVSLSSRQTTDVLICDSCYHRYYSDEAIRNNKLEKLLKEPLWRQALKIFSI